MTKEEKATQAANALLTYGETNCSAEALEMLRAARRCLVDGRSDLSKFFQVVRERISVESIYGVEFGGTSFHYEPREEFIFLPVYWVDEGRHAQRTVVLRFRNLSGPNPDVDITEDYAAKI